MTLAISLKVNIWTTYCRERTALISLFYSKHKQNLLWITRVIVHLAVNVYDLKDIPNKKKGKKKY